MTKINTMDQFYLYMFSQKIVLIREMVPFIINDEHKQTLTVLIDNAEKTLKEVPTGDVIKFINQNIEMIFSDQYMSVDLDDAALSLILKYANGIDEETFTFLFEKKGHMIIDMQFFSLARQNILDSMCWMCYTIFARNNCVLPQNYREE